MMGVLLEILLIAAALLVLLPVTVLFAEVLLAVTYRGSESVPEGERPRLAVVMPAHNEAPIIAATLRSLVPQLSAADRLIVVADNCSDETATNAAAQGAEVIERKDESRRGKGYALAFGIRHLESDAPDVVIVIDADCTVSAGSIDRLARRCVWTSRPVQALYLMHAPKGAGPKLRIAEFAWAVRNRIRPMGLHRLGLPCQLMGTGMAFSWASISAANLASGHLVEDLKLGIDLARAGTAPLFCPEALVTSYFPSSNRGVQSQHTRWEHGHLGVILSEAPRLFRDSFTALNLNLLSLALDLSVPPLTLLTLQVVAVWFVSIALYVLTRAQIPLVLATTAGVFLALSVLLSWARYGRHIISIGSFALTLAYALLKIPLYARFLVARQLDWVRSKRDGDG